MKGDRHAYQETPIPPWSRPRKPYTVVEISRERGGRRTDTTTSSLDYALRRVTELRKSGRPARVLDVDGRRIESRR